ncbi:protein translocase subunit SecD [Peptococcaceae bacterium]|nr:protein translocase subunit SecD [Peptococcaceae bacterium]
MKIVQLIKLIVLGIVIVFAVVLAIKPVFPKEDVPWLPLIDNIKLGLDLQGGVHVVLEAQDTDELKVNQEKMEALVAVIERRVNAFGAAEPVVQQQGERRVIVEIAGIDSPEKAVQSIIKTAYLEFISPRGDVILTGADLKNAVAQRDPTTDEIQVALKFTDEGTEKFAEATTRYLYQQIAIVLDGELLQNPVVREPILDGRAVITGYGALEEAHEIAVLLRSGALPLKVEVMQKNVVGPSLGKDSLNRSITAGIIGIALILAFMITYYRVPGLIANIALVFYSVLILAMFSFFNVTLTLSGIAGFILSLGIAVDSNIIIFERIKEELKRGKPLRPAVRSGFKRAFRAILDANVTTLIAAGVLFYFGTGVIKGFGLTLMIGILVSMFTAITLTRLMLQLVVDSRIVKNPKLYGA